MIYRWKDIHSKIKSIRSLRFSILIWLMIVGFIPSLILRCAILENYEERAVSVRTSEVQTQLKIIANHLNTYNYMHDTSSSVINAELDQIANLYDGRVLIIGDTLRILKDTYGISEGKTIISEEVVNCLRGNSTSNYDAAHGYIEVAIPIAPSPEGTAPDSEEDPKMLGAMLISISTDSIQKTMEILNRSAMILQVIMLIIVVFAAFWLSKFMTRPFRKVTEEINEIKDGFSDEPLGNQTYRETQHIADAFNHLLQRMKVLNDSREEFVSNVSHELKTPITSMKVLADSLTAMPDAPVELYKEFMADIASEIDRESKIITDLLSLVKMDKTAAGLNISEVDMNELTEIILKRLRPIARKQDIELTFESIRPVRAEIDEVKVTLILSNLVENAIKYNHEHGLVKVLLDADHQFFSVIVSDSGPGIPEEDLEHIFERFYRVDKSHSREIGGTGLGLSIARSAVLMHRGSIQVESTVGEGTTFTVRIPLKYLA